MVDDHPTQIEGYKLILGYNETGHDIVNTTAFNGESAYHIITNPVNAGRFDIVFLDLSLPPYPEKDIRSGEDLAVLVRKTWPKTKIVMLTSHAEAIVLYNIIKKVEPEGLLVKSDFSAHELLHAFEKIVNGETYHSATVRAGTKQLLSQANYLDRMNREIILQLSRGNKTKQIAEILNVSPSTVEKRKVHIKDSLDIEKGTDDDIVCEAKRRGFV